MLFRFHSEEEGKNGQIQTHTHNEKKYSGCCFFVLPELTFNGHVSKKHRGMAKTRTAARFQPSDPQTRDLSILVSATSQISPQTMEKNNSNLAKELKEYCRSPGTHKISEKPAALPEISWSTEENLLLADSSYCQVKEKGGGAPRKNTAFTRAHKIMKPGRKITKLDTMRGLAQTMQVYLKKSIYIYCLYYVLFVYRYIHVCIFVIYIFKYCKCIYVLYVYIYISIVKLYIYCIYI
jgi:hypothetical protein